MQAVDDMSDWGRERGWNTELRSRALVACDGDGHGCLVYWVGADLGFEVAEMGLCELADLGLDDAPRGLSIWEGRYVTNRVGGYDSPDVETEPSGRFRPLTAAEWSEVSQGRAPWDEAAWRVECLCDDLQRALGDHGPSCPLTLTHDGGKVPR